ncbi:hypothetical protein GW12_00900 [Acinetobacter sp. HR7]|nr:hypothetical protein GW12_00900 [Acinetobacter sp. HR7]
MPLPTPEQLTGPNVTEAQFKNGLSQLISGVVSKEQLEALKSINPATWFKTSSSVAVSYNSTTRTLSWSGSLLLNINSSSISKRTALLLPAHSITIPSSTYNVVWIDLSAIPESGTVDPVSIVKVGRYQDSISDPINAYTGAPHQLPIFYRNSNDFGPLNGFFVGEIEGVRSTESEMLKTEILAEVGADLLDIQGSFKSSLPVVWLKGTATTKISYDKDLRLLAWNNVIVFNYNNTILGRHGLAIPAHSITIPTTNFQVVWIDLRNLPVSASITDPSPFFKVGRYSDVNTDPNAYVGASYQLPIFVVNFGQAYSVNGFFDGEIEGVRSSESTLIKSEILSEISGLIPSTTLQINSGSSVYLNSDKLYEVSASGEQLLDDISPKKYLTAHKVANSAVTHADVSSISGVTSLAVSRLSNEVKRIPSADDLLIILPSYGQSNSVGVGGAGVGGAVPEQFMYDNPYGDRLFMFAGTDVRLGFIRDLENVVNGSTLTDFQPLKTIIDSANCGTSAIEGTGRALARQTELMGINSKILCFTSGRGASYLTDLVSGTVPYTNLMTGIERGVWVANKKGLKAYVPAIIFVHGEADHNNPNYEAELDAFYTQLNSDIKTRTGQSADVQLLVSQPSSFFSSVNGVLGLYNAAKNNPNIHLVSAGYHCSFISDYLHYDPKGHYKLGEYFAKALSNIVVGKKYIPLMPTAVVKKDATTIEITFNCVGNLVADTVNMTAKNSNWGFQIFNENTEISITSKSIVGNKVILTTSASLTSGRVDYAMQGQISPRSAENVPRGQLRDSSTYTSIVDGKPLYNWCVHFRETF